MDPLQRVVLGEVKVVQVVWFLALAQDFLVVLDYLLRLQSVDMRVLAVGTLAERRAADAGGVALAVVLLAAGLLAIAAASVQLFGDCFCFDFFVLRFEGEWVFLERLVDNEVSEVLELLDVMAVGAFAFGAAGSAVGEAFAVEF